MYDLVREIPFSPELAAKTRYTGYLDSRLRLISAPEASAELVGTAFGLPPERELILCLLGGGSDGAGLAHAFLECQLPPDAFGVLVTGPFMPAALRRRIFERAASHRHMRVLDFVTEPALLLQRASRVISMGGYNTTCDILSFEKPGLIVPRGLPRREQLIRAARLQALGLVEVIQPEAVTAQALTRWLAVQPSRPAGVRSTIDLDGLQRIPGLIKQLFARRMPRAASQWA